MRIPTIQPMDNKKIRIIDIPFSELQKKMAEYGQRQAASVRSARKYLRSIGLDIDKKGYVVS